ncbi:hypothetical protein [Streptomyces sp. NPDC057250]
MHHLAHLRPGPDRRRIGLGVGGMTEEERAAMLHKLAETNKRSENYQK